MFTLHLLLNDVGDFQEEEVTNIKNWDKSPDEAVVCLYSLRLIQITHVFLHQENKDGCLGKHLVKRQTCSQQEKFAYIYTQSTSFFHFYDGFLPNDQEVIQEV